MDYGINSDIQNAKIAAIPPTAMFALSTALRQPLSYKTHGENAAAVSPRKMPPTPHSHMPPPFFAGRFAFTRNWQLYFAAKFAAAHPTSAAATKYGENSKIVNFPLQIETDFRLNLLPCL